MMAVSMGQLRDEQMVVMMVAYLVVWLAASKADVKVALKVG